MLIRWLLAAIHLLAFGFVLGAVLARARALRRLDVTQSVQANELRLRDVFRSDSVWGITAIVLIVTGGNACVRRLRERRFLLSARAAFSFEDDGARGDSTDRSVADARVDPLACGADVGRGDRSHAREALRVDERSRSRTCDGDCGERHGARRVGVLAL